MGTPAGRGRRFEWRYAAAGLGWGAAVGVATGVVAALVAVVAALVDGVTGAVDGFTGATFLLLLPFLGAVYGVVPGAVVGVVVGLACAVVLPQIGEERRARRGAAGVSVAVGLPAMVLALVAASGGTWPAPVELGTALPLLALPVVVGAWLMARTAPTVRRQWERPADTGEHPRVFSPTSGTSVRRSQGPNPGSA